MWARMVCWWDPSPSARPAIWKLSPPPKLPMQDEHPVSLPRATRRRDRGGLRKKERKQNPRAPRRMAVLVGAGARVLDANGKLLAVRAHHDVAAIQALLLDICGFREQDITVLIDKEGMKERLRPTKLNVVSVRDRPYKQMLMFARSST
jgi:hypothetical protein